MDSAAAVERSAAGRGTGEHLIKRQPWKGERRRTIQLAGGQACDTSSQEVFLSTLRLGFSDVLIGRPVSGQSGTSSYSSRNGDGFGMGEISATGRVRHRPRRGNQDAVAV